MGVDETKLSSTSIHTVVEVFLRSRCGAMSLLSFVRPLRCPTLSCDVLALYSGAQALRHELS